VIAEAKLATEPQLVFAAPCIHTEGHDPIQVSFDMPAAVIKSLKKKGHQV
jgi:hypothetical protein